MLCQRHHIYYSSYQHVNTATPNLVLPTLCQGISQPWLESALVSTYNRTGTSCMTTYVSQLPKLSKTRNVGTPILDNVVELWYAKGSV